MPCSLVLGVNGQDGSYVAESLLRRGHKVVGVGRDVASRYVSGVPNFRYVNLDLRDSNALTSLVEEVMPDFAFHFAAVHGAAGFQYEPVVGDMFATNVVALHVLLEFARVSKPSTRIVYAGSSKIFPAPLEGVISENSPARSTCLYSIGKMAARDLIFQYRKQHNVMATNLILFNHESPRRPPQFLLPILAQGIIDSLKDSKHAFKVQTLDFWIDWAAADELADIAVDIAEKSHAVEFVLASGVTHHAREVVSTLFRAYGLQSELCIVEALERRDPGPHFQVSLKLLENEIERVPVKSVADIVHDMLIDKKAVLPQGMM